MERFKLTATTLFGLEDILAGELKGLGATDIQIMNRAVQFEADEQLMYEANLKLRTALKVLKPISFFQVRDDKQLYKKSKEISWEDYFTFRHSFAIDAVTFGEVFRHSRYAALKVKDAIADRFREKFGIRPSVDSDRPDISINVHIAETRVTISLNSSGHSLNRRGYRQDMSEAPVNEVLAAGMVILSEWDKKESLLDPMCGSGTIPIEAAMIAGNYPPGRLRNFAFESWNDFDENLWNKIREKAENEISKPSCRIIGTDSDQKAINNARRNIRRAGLGELISLKREDLMESEKPESKGVIVMNPPYGERLGIDRGINQLYDNIGSRLKHNFEGWDAWIISSNMEALKHIGLKPSQKIKLFNGALECRFNKYELYQGSRKT